MRGMRVVYNQGQILVFEIQECTGAKLDRLICNIDDDKQGLKILNILQEKYGFLTNVKFVINGEEQKPQPDKKFLDY